MADISKIKPNERKGLDVLLPNGAKSGIAINLISMDDPRMKAVRRSINDAKLKLEQRGKGFTSEDIEANNVRLATAALTGWEWGDDEDGEPATYEGKVPEFNTKNVKEVLTNVDWFLAFIGKELDETAAFF